jgi:DNA modification methylase
MSHVPAPVTIAIAPASSPGPSPTAVIERNRLIEADNLAVLRALPDAAIDLIYVDPPFCTGKRRVGRYGAFADAWGGDVPLYVEWLSERLTEMRRVLRSSGSLYVHLDWHTVHYVKVAMDGIFGADCFLNDIAWLYGLGGSSARYWPRKHDRLLWYSRLPDGHWFEAVRVPARSRRMAGASKKAPDYWDIPSLNNMAAERLGYPSQKPEALLERIIAGSCPPGGVVADVFCGSGTTVAVAHRLDRRWLACDSSPEAVRVTADRLHRMDADFDLERWPA